MKRTDRGLLRRAGVLLAVVSTALVTAAAVPAVAAPGGVSDAVVAPASSPSPTATAGTCAFTNTLCLYDQAGFGGVEFNVKALDPAVGACVDLVAHGWGGGRVKSAINTNPRSATLFPNADCTGRGWPIEGPFFSFDVFAANSAFVW